jgi:hypothetical protein
MKVCLLGHYQMASQVLHESLFALEDHEISEVPFDKSRPAPARADWLLAEIDGFDPDVVIYESLPIGTTYLPPQEIFPIIRKRRKLVYIAGDLSDPVLWQQVHDYEDQIGGFDLKVAIDGNDNWPHGPRDLTLLTPPALKFFQDLKPLIERPIPLSYCGSICTDIRVAYLKPLLMNGMIMQPRDERYGTYGAFADTLRKTRVTPNIPFVGSNNIDTQVKGRITEAGAAGCCLLEWKGSITSEWFRPGVDYVPYDDPADLLKTATYYAGRPELAQPFADNLHRRVLEEHSANVFWGKIFKILEAQ